MHQSGWATLIFCGRFHSILVYFMSSVFKGNFLSIMTLLKILLQKFVSTKQQTPYLTGAQKTASARKLVTQAYIVVYNTYASSSLTHTLSSLPFITIGRMSSFAPNLMEFCLVVTHRRDSNWKNMHGLSTFNIFKETHLNKLQELLSHYTYLLSDTFTLTTKCISLHACVLM